MRCVHAARWDRVSSGEGDRLKLAKWCSATHRWSNPRRSASYASAILSVKIVDADRFRSIWGESRKKPNFVNRNLYRAIRPQSAKPGYLALVRGPGFKIEHVDGGQ